MEIEKCYAHCSCDEFQPRCKAGKTVAKRGELFYFTVVHDNKIYICRSNEIGDKGKVIAEGYRTSFPKEYVQPENGYLAVNSKGIMYAYLCCFDGAPKDFKPQLYVGHLNHKGELISEMVLDIISTFDGEYHHPEISNFYVCDEQLYYAVQNKIIVRVDMNKKNVATVFEASGTISGLFSVNGDRIIVCDDDGWKVHDQSNNLTDLICSEKNKILFVNAAMGIAWAEGARKNVDIVTMNIDDSPASHSNEEAVLAMPVYLWGKLKKKKAIGVFAKDYFVFPLKEMSGNIYFDGEYLFRSNDHDSFFQLSNFGSTIYEWSGLNGGHGNCDKYFVKGQCVFVDIDANGLYMNKLPASLYGRDGSTGYKWPFITFEDKDFKKFVKEEINEAGNCEDENIEDDGFAFNIDDLDDEINSSGVDLKFDFDKPDDNDFVDLDKFYNPGTKRI
ncbi:MAG: hypothetical protein K5871_03950 [Lachnospiraceae bacterium]|nr:hypothetical protein [Lachnospiraceae bacterium]